MEYDINELRKKYNVNPSGDLSSPASSGNQPATAPASGYDINELRKKYNVNPSGDLTQPSSPSPAKTSVGQVDEDPGYLDRVKAGFSKAADERAAKIGEIADANASGKQSFARSLFQFGGQAIGAALDAPMEVISQAIPKTVKDIAGKALDSTVGAGVRYASDKIADIPAVQKFAMTDESKKLARDIEAGNEYLNLAPVPKGSKALAKVADKTAEVAGKVVDRTVTPVIEAQAKRAVAKTNTKIDDLVGAIVQGSKDDIPRARKALSSIDTTGVKNAEDLGGRIDSRIKDIATGLDKVLDQSTERKMLKDLSMSTKVGGQTISHNYVDDALNQLDELYSKTNDPVASAKIRQLKAKAESEGLTIREINDLAREHGSEFGKKAFNKMGDPLTSVNAQAFENTRSGLKGTARDIFKDDIYRAADEEMSHLIRTRTLVNKLEESANKLKQRVIERNLGQKVVYLATYVADRILGGGIRGFAEYIFPQSSGKFANIFDIEQALKKNLEQFNKLIKSDLPEQTIIQRLEEMAKVKLPPKPPKLQGAKEAPRAAVDAPAAIPNAGPGQYDPGTIINNGKNLLKDFSSLQQRRSEVKMPPRLLRLNKNNNRK